MTTTAEQQWMEADAARQREATSGSSAYAGSKALDRKNS